MRFGICHNVHIDGVPQRESLDAIRSLLGRDPFMRSGGDASRMFPTADTRDFDDVYNMYDASLSAGFSFYFNLVEWPAWATGGVPLYVSGIGGWSCSKLYHRLLQLGVDDPTCRMIIDQFYTGINPTAETASADERVNALRTIVERVAPKLPIDARFDFAAREFEQHYKAERGRTGCCDDPFSEQGFHLYGDNPDLDKYSYPRPWVLTGKSAPDAAVAPIDLAAVQYMGEQIGEAFRRSEIFVFGNEPDIAYFWSPTAIDRVNKPGGPDVFVRYRVVQKAFMQGVAIGVARATLNRKMPLLGGPEIAYPGTFDRFPANIPRYDVLTTHGYGSPASLENSYQHLTEYAAIVRSRKCPWIISEIGFAGQMAEWLGHVKGMGLPLSGIIFGSGDLFIPGFIESSRHHSAQPAVSLNADGQAVADLIAQTSGRRRAAGGK